MSLGKSCLHGVAWSESCLRCERVSVAAFLQWAEPKVIRYKARLAELNRSILADEMESERTRLRQSSNCT